MRMMPQQNPGRSKQDYATPAAFIAAVQARVGIEAFAVDLAADAGNAKAARYLDVTTNALRVDWRDQVALEHWAWLNPPFADIEPWARKCAALREAGGQVAFLVPASVGANWFRDFVHDRAAVLFLNPRLSFLDNGMAYPKDCLLALFSPALAPGYDCWHWPDQVPRMPPPLLQLLGFELR